VKYILFCISLCIEIPIFSQVFGELLPGSSQLIYDEKVGVHKLLDGANFVYQGNTLYCDSALYIEKDKTIRAYGHVHIRKSDSINLFCDSLYYYTQTSLADLWGNVRAINEQYRLTTEWMTYDTKTEQGTYVEGGKIENMLQNEVLTSQIGYFYPKIKQFHFQKNVNFQNEQIRLTTDSLQFDYDKNRVYFYGETCILTEDAILESLYGWYDTETENGSLVKNASIEQQTRIIKGDSLVYLPQEKRAEGFGNVYVYDTIDKMSFQGNYAIIDDSTHYSLLTHQAVATKYQKNDTIHILADTIYNKNDSIGTLIYTQAFHQVKLLGTSLQGISDSLSYEKENEKIELYYSPILWAKNGELKGDSIKVYINDTTVREAVVVGKATAVMQLDSGRYYNQVGGNQMIAYLENNQVVKARIVGNAQTIFFPEENSKDSVASSLEIEDSIVNNTDSLTNEKTVVEIKRLGMNRFFASDITIHFEQGEVIGITYYQQPDGVFYPMNLIKEEEQFIQHFSTHFDMRPQSLKELLNDDFLDIQPQSDQ